MPKEMMSTSRQMGRLGETVANGIDRARFDVRGVIIGGGIAGILAGVVMAMAAMFYAAANGSGFFLPVRSIAATWYGANALLGGAGVLIAGLATHLGTSAFGGVVFAALPSSRKSATVALLSGLVWGVVVWAILSIAVMPWLNPTMYAGTVVAQSFRTYRRRCRFGQRRGRLRREVDRRRAAAPAASPPRPASAAWCCLPYRTPSVRQSRRRPGPHLSASRARQR